MGWRDSLVDARGAGPSVVTIGTFDGVHVGHRYLVGWTARRARELDACATAITFHPRPGEILRPDQPSLYLCSLEERCRRLREAGADRVLSIPFTHELSTVSAEDFVESLVNDLEMRLLVGGPDLALGRGRKGTPALLQSIGDRRGFSVEIVDGFAVDGRVVRTSAIREALTAGDLPLASRLLGRPYAIEGKVVRGVGRGRMIGVPTANVRTADNLVLPGNGVYAVRFRVDERSHDGAANLGVRPTFEGVGRTLEVHLLDFTGDLYDRSCQVEFVERLRPEQRFPSVDELVRQIQQDIADARRVLQSRSA